MTDQAPTTDAPATPPTSEAPAAPATEAPKAPKWDGDFDPDRAARLVENLRKENAEAKAKAEEYAAKLKEIDDSKKSESEKLLARAEAAEKDLAETKKALIVGQVSAEFGVHASYLTGSTKAELEASAKALAEWRNGAPAPAPSTSSKPKPRLTPGEGTAPTTDENDPAAIAAAIRKSRY